MTWTFSFAFVRTVFGRSPSCSRCNCRRLAGCAFASWNFCGSFDRLANRCRGDLCGYCAFRYRDPSSSLVCDHSPPRTDRHPDPSFWIPFYLFYDPRLDRAVCVGDDPHPSRPHSRVDCSFVWSGSHSAWSDWLWIFTVFLLCIVIMDTNTFQAVYFNAII